jgi:hypothetical protein
MKKFGQYTEQLDFDQDQGRNIVVGSYETENFDICPGAVEGFQLLTQQEGIDMAKVEQAAVHVDHALGIEKQAAERGFSTNEDLENYDHHAAAAEEILDDLGELENHEFYLRDVHEPNLVDMLDVESTFSDEEIDDELHNEEVDLDDLDEQFDVDAAALYDEDYDD